MDNLFKPADLRKGFTGPKRAKRSNHVVGAFLTLVLTVCIWIVWVGGESNTQRFSGLRFMIATETHDFDAGRPSYRPYVHTWVQYPVTSNETAELLGQLEDHAGAQCRTVETSKIRLLGFPEEESGQPIRLSAGPIHKVFIVSLDDEGEQLCEGGDYYETDLSGERWKARPPVRDLRNGTYEIQLQVDERFAGLYEFKVILLYSRFHGLERIAGPISLYRQEELLSLKIQFVEPNRSLNSKSPGPPVHAELDLCGNGDYDLSRWSGRWTRSQNNESCTVNSGGRYQCLPPGTECELPWCEGPLDRVDSNGWVYSAHCRFKLFTPDEAWNCLDKKWLFSWGDSTSQHTWQNLLAFIMDFATIETVEVPRRMDREWVRPGGGANKGLSQSLRLTMVYNGHAEEEGTFQGLESLNVPSFRAYLRGFFINADGPTYSPPDILVMNSGLHDAFHYKGPADFVQEGVSTAIEFWKEILDAISPKSLQIIYRTTVATAGKARSIEYNPQKMEHFNRLFVDSLKKLHLSDFRVVDGFDLTFPWHYDNNYSDGTHYGLKPSLGTPGHHYFVDHMFAHMLLNSICLR